MIKLMPAGAAALVLAGMLVLSQGSAQAETIKYKADLVAAMEVPPTESKGTGTTDATYDTATKKLTWSVTYSDLTGPATASHFHSPAAVGANAPPTVPLSGDLKSPIKGEATLTDAQAKDLADGKMYFNIHTAANPGGEIRGQVMPAK